VQAPPSPFARPGLHARIMGGDGAGGEAPCGPVDIDGIFGPAGRADQWVGLCSPGGRRQPSGVRASSSVPGASPVITGWPVRDHSL
jgi:hypothetical protein